jgi:transcriptional regulator with XRE-family HTH domain
MSAAFTEGMNPEALLPVIGERLAALRVSKRYTQAKLADIAGISRATLHRLENGQGGDLKTFLAVLSALDRISALEVLLPEIPPSPIELLKRSGQRPKRVGTPRKKKKTKPPRESWKWGDEQ